MVLLANRINSPYPAKDPVIYTDSFKDPLEAVIYPFGRYRQEHDRFRERDWGVNQSETYLKLGGQPNARDNYRQ
jgi:hypothetical protein